MSIVYGKLPVFIDNFPGADLKEVMYYLYLPVRMAGSRDVRLPVNIAHLLPMLTRVYNYAAKYLVKQYAYAYVSARKGFASPDNPLNRPGWHADGFGTEDVNFVWWSGAGTRFAHQAFDSISPDHLESMKQFEEQVRAENVVTYPEHGLYMIDPSVVHATPIIQPPGEMRQYIKISLSDHRYNLENNSHNYLFDYNWPMFGRDATRNDPNTAQQDYVDEYKIAGRHANLEGEDKSEAGVTHAHTDDAA